MERWKNGMMEEWNGGRMEWWNDGVGRLEEWDGLMDRKNINRGFKQLRVWQDSVSLYVMACGVLSRFPFDLKRVAATVLTLPIASAEILQKAIAGGA